MGAIAAALLYTLFVWWFSTGLVMLLVLRTRRAAQASVVGAALVFPLCVVVLVRSATMTGLLGVYLAFTAAIVLWGTQEVAFLSGAMTGPRPSPCPPDVRGLARFRRAVGAILYHEIALAVIGVALIAMTWGAPNPFGGATFAVLWIMRISAKVNLFLGVPVLNDEFLPEPVAFLRTHFRRGPVNAVFVLALICSIGLCIGLAAGAVDPQAEQPMKVGYTLVAALVALAVIEHLFMLIPLPVERLWRWSAGRRHALGRRAATGDPTLEKALPIRP